MANGTLYFHKACFDGLVSGALAWNFLESEKWKVRNFIPVDYNARSTWLRRRLKKPAAVVDFLYHPDADFWADHHSTAFLTDEARDDFAKRSSHRYLVFNPEAGSCAGLLWNSLRSFMPDSEHYREAVEWAEKIDSANYSSVEEAVWGDSPALFIRQSLVVKNDAEYSRFLMRKIRTRSLDQIVALSPVRKRIVEARQQLKAGMDGVRSHAHLRDGVVVMDFHAKGDEVVSRYAPYYFFPKARYSISILRSDAGIMITAMRNPWMDFKSVPIGSLLESFGGGGHERVGSVLIPPNRGDIAELVLDRLKREMQSQSAIVSVTA